MSGSACFAKEANSPASSESSDSRTSTALDCNLEGKLNASPIKEQSATYDDLKSVMSRKRESKPGQSYIAMIARAILESPEKKLSLHGIYQYISENYSQFKSKVGWRNSVRHNLSLNECFIKAGRCESGKGNYWAIHPANFDDFARGDFRRRHARNRVRKSRFQFTRPGLCSVPLSGGSNAYWFQKSPSALLSSVSPLSHHVYAPSASTAAPAVLGGTPAVTGGLARSGSFTGAGSPAHRTNSTKKTFSIDNLLNQSKDVSSVVWDERKDLVHPRAFAFGFPTYARRYGLGPASPCLTMNSWTAPGFRLS